MLSEKYAPTTLNGIVGNDSAVAALRAFADKINKGERAKPMVLFGPSGTGKTAAARALAYSSGFELLELTASDYRDAESLNKTVIPASRSKGLFGKTILILLDEIDEVSKKYDSGLERIVGSLLKDSRQPVVFTAEDYWDPSIRFLRGGTDKVEFRKVNNDVMAGFLRNICKKEGVGMEDSVIETVAKRSKGDMRGAMNDMEAMFGAGAGLLDSIGIRDTKLEIFGVLDKIFLSNSFDMARNAVAKSDVDIDMLLNWVDENVPTRYTSNEEISSAYASIAEASRFYEKAGRTNYWGYLRYVSTLLSSGVALSNDGYVRRLKPYSFPTKIRHMAGTKGERSAMREIADRLGDRFHTSRRKIVRDYIPLLRIIFNNAVKENGEEEAAAGAQTALGLSADEFRFILSG